MTLDPLSLDRLGEQRSWAYRIARQLVRRDEEAEEIVQRAWITAWRRPPSGERGWRPWMRTVILNLVRERSRRDETRRRHERAALPPALDPVDPTCEDAEQREVRERLAVRVGRLPEPYRTVLRLRYYDELTSPEIGARLGVPAGTVRWRLKVALDLLREDLDREAGGDRSRWLSAVLAAWPALRSDVGRGAGALPGSARSGGPLLPLAVGASLAVVLGLGLSMVAQRAPRATGEVAAAVTRARGDRELPVLAPGRAEPRTPVATGAASPDPGSAGLLVEVVDPAGTLLADARVEVFDGSTFRERGRTAADGRGRVTLLPGDLGAAHTGARVAIRARAEGQAVSEVLHVPAPHARTEPGSPGKTGGETGVVRLVTSGPARRLTGVVLAPDGRPVAGAQVAWVERRQQMRAGGTELRGPCALETRTGADGTFTLEHLPLDADGLFCFSPGWMVGRLNVLGRDHVELRLEPGARVHGHVRHPDGRPAVGVEVALDPLFPAPAWCRNLGTYDSFREGFGERTTTRSDGSFELLGVHPGQRRLWAQDPVTGATATLLRTIASDPLEWEARLEAHTPLRLMVVNAAGVPLAGWQVQLRAPSGTGTPWTRRHITDPAGRVTLVETPASPMVASVFPPGGAEAALAIRRGLVPDEVEQRIVVPEESPCALSGRVVDEAGQPYAAGQLLLYSHRTLTHVGLARGRDGRFRGEALPGLQSLFLQDDGGLLRLAAESLVADRTLDLGTLMLPARGLLRLRSTRQDGREQGYRIDLRLEDRTGPHLPVTGGRFEGELELALHPGTYRVFGAGEEPVEVTLTSRGTAEVVLER